MACADSHEISLEAWITPATEAQSGPARIVSISNGSLLRNVTLGHGLWGALPPTTYNVRLRTSAAEVDDNGSPDLQTPEGAAAASLQHVVYTRASSGRANLFVDGALTATGVVPGDLSNWDPSYRLALGNEIGAERPWLGELHLVAVYDRALSSQEIASHHALGPGDSTEGFLEVAPVADFVSYGTVGSEPLVDSMAYVATNIGGSPMKFGVSSSEKWVSITGHAEVELTPGESQAGRIRIDGEKASRLPAGSHTARVSWRNLTNSHGDFDQLVRLTVYDPGAGRGHGQRPGPYNTGPSKPAALLPSGSIVANQDGQVIENVEVTGSIRIEANNVTVRNFRVNGSGSHYGVQTGFDFTGTVLEDGEILNVSSACIFGKGFTARRLNLHESGGDGVKTRGDVLVEACWIHHLGSNPGAHADGNQTRVGDRIVFRDNNIDMPVSTSPNGEPGYLSNAALIIQDSLGTIDDFLIEGNWLNGGNYTVFITPNHPSGITNLRVLNNRFGRDYRYGPFQTGGIPMIVSGNVWDDTGELLDANNQ